MTEICTHSNGQSEYRYFHNRVTKGHGCVSPGHLLLWGVSDRAWNVIEKNRTPAYYLNLLSYHKWAAKGINADNPAISLILGLSAVCDLIDEEGGF